MNILGQLLVYGTERRRNKNALPQMLVKGRPDSPHLSMLA
ncbi:rCG37242 [Rattus norvegicus]|uniref:RCG37242 n=1 Tax=Rattus norvegicus TaxID=10116 RepID=A6KHS2_RAT|nr:rCG37242 [Rattus norvegicus]